MVSLDTLMLKKMIVILFMLQALFFGLITAFLAGQKGYDIYIFYFIGIVIWPFGILSAMLPEKKGRSTAIDREIEAELRAA